MKQTAVEWLMQQLKNIDITHKEVFEQAKEMELHQMEFFYKKGHLYSGCPYGLEDVFKETFKQKEDESND